MPFTVVCVFPSQQTKLDMAPSYHEGRRGQWLTELRVTEGNILQRLLTLQQGAFQHLRFSVTKSFAQLTAKMCKSQLASGMNTLLQRLMKYYFAFDKKVNAVYTFIHHRKYWNQSLVAE